MINSDLKEGSILNAISVDVEEWYQTILFSENNNTKGQKVTNLPGNIADILSLLDEYNTKATFFIVGSLAEKYPKTIKMIADSGHEICSHNYYHRLVYKMSKEEFSRELMLSLDILRNNTNAEVLGFRAPSWSITNDSHWSIDILHSFGLKYDSSVYPVSLNLFNSQSHKRFPYKIKNDFIEFPPSTFQFLGNNFPFAGGTFLRFFPFDFIKNKILNINQKRQPAMVYFHSWEFDDAASIPNIPKLKYLVQYHNHNSVRNKIELLLQNFKFSSIKEVLQLK